MSRKPNLYKKANEDFLTQKAQEEGEMKAAMTLAAACAAVCVGVSAGVSPEWIKPRTGSYADADVHSGMEKVATMPILDAE